MLEMNRGAQYINRRGANEIAVRGAGGSAGRRNPVSTISRNLSDLCV